MPTDRPRLTITLTPEIDRALTDFSRLTGESKSAFIVQVLAEAVPHLDRMAVVMQQASKLHGDAYKATRYKLAQYADAVTVQAASTMRNADLFLDMSAAAMAQGERADASSPSPKPAAGAAPSVQPPPVNKGVRNTGKGEKESGKVVSMRSRK